VSLCSVCIGLIEDDTCCACCLAVVDTVAEASCASKSSQHLSRVFRVQPFKSLLEPSAFSVTSQHIYRLSRAARTVLF